VATISIIFLRINYQNFIPSTIISSI